MALRVSGKNLKIGASLRSYVRTRIDATIAKYSSGATRQQAVGHVTIEPVGSGYRADCTLYLESGMTLQAEAEAHEPYASFDRAADRIEKRLRRFKERLGERHHADTAASRRRSIPKESEAADQIDTASPPGPHPAIIAEPACAFAEMTVSRAVEELDGTKAPFVIFRHPSDGRPNIIYRRSDGHIGWIDPQAAGKNATR